VTGAVQPASSGGLPAEAPSRPGKQGAPPTAAAAAAAAEPPPAPALGLGPSAWGHPTQPLEPMAPPRPPRAKGGMWPPGILVCALKAARARLHRCVRPNRGCAAQTRLPSAPAAQPQRASPCLGAQRR
jgi:hypothetical protein